MLEVNVKGEEGNCFFIMGMVKRALLKAGQPRQVIDKYFDEAKSADYDNLLEVSEQYLNDVGIDINFFAM